MSKDEKEGSYFSMGDGDHKRLKKKRRSEVMELKSQFMNKAKQFMDESSLGEIKELKDGKKLLKKFLGTEDAEPVEESSPQSEDWEDEEWEDFDEDEELYDMSEPEKIRVGYLKPGTEPLPEKKTLEDAREESFDLKLGNLSGLLTRFGAEGAEEVEDIPEKTARQIDKTAFQETMNGIYQSMALSVGESQGVNWLKPDILALLLTQNETAKILDFVFAATFAVTPENFMTESDKRRVVVLFKQVGGELSSDQIEEHIQHTFLFSERVFRLFDELQSDPPQLKASILYQYKQNLSKFYIRTLAENYDVVYQEFITRLNKVWNEQIAYLKELLPALTQAKTQYLQLLEKKVTSGTLFHKLVTIETQGLQAWRSLELLAKDISCLTQVTAVIGEDEALERLASFPLDIFGFSPLKSPLSLTELTDLFHSVRENTDSKAAVALISETDAIQSETSELSPLNQKRAITQAKAGQIRALKTIDSYKQFKIGHVLAGLQEEKE